jgi:hypothetical protein
MTQYPAETVVYMSPRKRLPWLLVFVVGEIVAVYLLLHLRPVLTLGYLFWCVAAVIFPLGIVDSLWDLVQKRPRLRLSLRGLQKGNQPLDDWRDIRQEQVLGPYSALKAVSAMLTYKVNGKLRQVDLSECTHDAATVRELLIYYRRHAQHPPGSGRPRKRRFED